MRNAIVECERAAFEAGLAAGLAVALEGWDAGAAPGGVAALPRAAVPAGAAVIPHEMAASQGIAFVRCDARRGVPDGEVTAVAAAVGAVRIGVTRQLTEKVVAHLSHRVVGGEPTISKQLVQGTLADAEVVTETARRCLLLPGHRTRVVADVHDRLTALDWELAKLLGGSGYVGRGPACAAFVSRLTANCWVPRGGAV